MRIKPSRPGRIGLHAVLLVISFSVATGPAGALTDEEIFREFQFQFQAPGARALGMGGSAIATGNDSASLLTNPAVLHYIEESEFQISFNSFDPDTRTFSSQFGDLSVDPLSGARNLPFLALTSVSNGDSTSDIDFSFALPFRVGATGRRLNLAASRQVMLADDRTLSDGATTTQVGFAFNSFPNTVSGGQIVAYSVDAPVTGSSKTDIVYLNVGGSFAVHPDFSIGLTVSVAELEQRANTLTTVNDPLQLFLDPTHPRLPGQTSTDEFATIISDTDSDVVWTVGLNWHPDSVFAGGDSPWRFGAVYRKGAEFSVTESTFLNRTPDQTFDNQIIVPDRYGVAASYTPDPRWIFTIEWERVELSDMLEGFASGVNYLTGGSVAGAFPVNPAVPVLFDINDGDIPRIGAEFAHQYDEAGSRRLQLWGGWYRSPDTRIRMTQFNSTDPAVNAVYLDAFGGGDDENHFTAGGGFSIGAHSFQVAGDISDLGDRIVGTYIFRVGR